MVSKRNFGTIKSLLHFDFPYYKEPNDGLDDDVGLEEWAREGNTMLAGNLAPKESTGSPMFGYRCAYFPDNTSYITNANTSGIFNLNASGSYEFECFVEKTGTEGTILTVGDLELGIDEDNHITLTSETWNINTTSSYIVFPDVYEHLMLRVDNGSVKVYACKLGLSYYNGHTFKYYDNYKYWGEAKAACEALGGHLATSTSTEKNSFLTSLSSNANVWLGGTAEAEDRTWRWITGEDWDYTNWYVEPSNNITTCVYISSGGYWYEHTNDYGFYYICEWDYLASQTPQEILNVSITGNSNIEPDSVKLGGYVGYMDEFVFRHSASTEAPTLPTHPYSGKVEISDFGGWGTGSEGNLAITSNTQLNTYGLINSVIDSKTFTVTNWSEGLSTPFVGSEVMLHITAPKSTQIAKYPLVGLHAFCRVASMGWKTIKLVQAVTIENGYDFTLNSSLLDTYYVQMLTVPNYKNFLVKDGAAVTTRTWRSYNDDVGGGIIAFRTTGNVTVNGNILTHGGGATRYDLHQMTNGKLIDRFLCARGGGIFIACGGTFTATSTARLGASWSGLGDSENGHGAAGYGGNGGSIVNSKGTLIGTGGLGGVGGGGGGASNQSSTAYANGGAVGANGGDATYVSGGGGGCCGNGGTPANTTNTSNPVGGGGGGCQGRSTGGLGGYGKARSGSDGNGPNGGNGGQTSGSYYGGGGGGAPGGQGGPKVAYQSWWVGPASGACVILLCNRLNINALSISTGGASGGTGTTTAVGMCGGGGTGFCYIACREQVNDND